MQTRKLYLEIALKKSIEVNDLEGFSRLFKLMQEICPDSCGIIDENGKSFLFIALELGASEIAHEFLKLHQFNREILFTAYPDRLTLLHLAVRNGDCSMTAKLIEIAEKRKKMDVYLSRDNSGSSVLHIAANLIHPEQNNIVNLLLSKIAQHTDLKEFVNQNDCEDNTALHLALKIRAEKTANLLINAGATLYLDNGKDGDITIFLLSKLSVEKQAEVFNSLDKTQQKIVLKLYGDYLNEILKTDNENDILRIKNNLFTLAGLQSLKTLLIYYHKYNLVNYDINVETDDLNESEKNIEILQDAIKSFYADLLLDDAQFDNRSDRQKISSLIKMLEDFQESLQSRYQGSILAKVIAITYSLSWLSAYIGINVLIYKKMGGLLKAEFFPLIGFVSFAVFGWMPIILGLGGLFAEARVFRSEWEPLINQLKTELMDELRELEKMDTLRNTNDLPTDVQNIRNMENDVDNLQHDQWTLWNSPYLGWRMNSLWKPISEVRNTVTSLQTTIETIRRDVIVTNKPVSLKLAKKEYNNSDVIINFDEPDDGKEKLFPDSDDSDTDTMISIFSHSNKKMKESQDRIADNFSDNDLFASDDDSTEELVRYRK